MYAEGDRSEAEMLPSFPGSRQYVSPGGLAEMHEAAELADRCGTLQADCSIYATAT